MYFSLFIFLFFLTISVAFLCIMHNGKRRVGKETIYKQGNHQTKRRHASYFLWLWIQQNNNNRNILHDTLLSINKRQAHKNKINGALKSIIVKNDFLYFAFRFCFSFSPTTTTTTTINYQHKQDTKFVAKVSVKEIHKRHLKWQTFAMHIG